MSEIVSGVMPSTYEWTRVNEPLKKGTDMGEEKIFAITIKFTNGDRECLDFSNIKIVNGCLIITDPSNYIPREVHCYPFASIKSFTFDLEAWRFGKVSLETEGKNGKQSRTEKL